MANRFAHIEFNRRKGRYVLSMWSRETGERKLSTVTFEEAARIAAAFDPEGPYVVKAGTQVKAATNFDEAVAAARELIQ